MTAHKCDGCDGAWQGDGETLTQWRGRFIYPWCDPLEIDAHYCAGCLTEIRADRHYKVAAQ